MCLKFETDPDEVFLIEATGNAGVGINKWSALKEHVGTGKFYDKCVFRHVEVQRTDDMIESLEKFLSQAVGLSYGLTPGKLMRKTTVAGDMAKNIDSDRTFFCSELVAKAFKTLGIMISDDTSSTQFLPGSFSSRDEALL